MGGTRLKIHDSLSGYEENRLVRTKTFSAHNKPKMNCTPKVGHKTDYYERV